LSSCTRSVILIWFSTYRPRPDSPIPLIPLTERSHYPSSIHSRWRNEPYHRTPYPPYAPPECLDPGWIYNQSRVQSSKDPHSRRMMRPVIPMRAEHHSSDRHRAIPFPINHDIRPGCSDPRLHCSLWRVVPCRSGVGNRTQ
jgi:hypothetical protein